MNDDLLPSDVISALEACRPDRQDERLPEVAAALANTSPERVAKARRAIEGFDRAVRTAIRQAPVPEGLAQRVLARVALAEESLLRNAATLPTEAGELRLPPPGERTAAIVLTDSRVRRRPLFALMVGGGLAIAASLLIALMAWPRGTVDVAALQTQASEFYRADKQHVLAAGDAFPTALGGVAAGKVAGWHPIKLFDRHGFGYDLADRRTRSKGALYVLPLSSWRGPKLSGLNAVPLPQSTSGTTVAIWVDDTSAYVLVVEGGMSAFSSFLPQRVA